jgi:hypothetical protein
MKRAWIVLASALTTLSIAALSRAPYSPPGRDDALLRFSWRMSVAAREHCRARTQAELDALPVHMRAPEICTREEATYALVTQIDELDADTLPVARGGAKGDRPIFVLEQRVLTPGSHRVRAHFYRTTNTSDTALLAGLDTTLVMERGGVQLVTLASESRRLTVRTSTIH